MEILWRKTWDDKEDDYSAYDGETYIGRVYLVTTAGVSDYWGWFPVRGGPSGRADSRREAMLAIEEAWERPRR